MSQRVLVGLSGGVDSAVAAHLLVKQGYEVVAGFMKNYTDESNPNCHTREDRDIAIEVAQHLGIKTFVIFDFREQYDQKIVKYIYDGYQAGTTPNPDVLCNSEIKFDIFMQEALRMGCDAIATGHYARIEQDDSGCHLLKGVDNNKDQSYFLAGLNQEQLSKSIFPIGDINKDKVRKIAQEIQLPNADRKDSQGLCFIGKVDMKSFLQNTLPVKKGNIVDTEGNILGEHEGVHFYTIGQRQGLGLSAGPWYVTHRDIETNTLTVGPGDTDQLYHNALTATQRHRVGESKQLPLQANAKIRYRQSDQIANIVGEKDGIIEIHFAEKQRAISIGQVVAIYEGDELLASGIIHSTYNV